MLTSEIIAAIQRDYPDTQVPQLLLHINEVQRILLSRPIPTRRIVDKSTGKDPAVDFIPGQAFFNVDVYSGFPEDALIVEKVYAQDIEYPETVDLREADELTPAQVIFNSTEAAGSDLTTLTTSKVGTVVTAEGGGFFTKDDINGTMYLYENATLGVTDQDYRTKITSVDESSETSPGSGEYTRVNVTRVNNNWTSQNTVVQIYNGSYYIRAYKKPKKISSPSIQLEVPAKYHYDIVFQAVMGLVERDEYGRSQAWYDFEHGGKQRFWSEQSVTDTFNENRTSHYE